MQLKFRLSRVKNQGEVRSETDALHLVVTKEEEGRFQVVVQEEEEEGVQDRQTDLMKEEERERKEVEPDIPSSDSQQHHLAKA